MNRPVFVADSAVSSFGTHTGHDLVGCAASAVLELTARHPALTEIDSMWLGSARPGQSEGWESGLAVAVAEATGFGGAPATDVHAFCASSNVAFIHATREIASGRADVVLVVGVEHMSSYGSSGPLTPPAMPSWAQILSPPVFYALCASRYLHDHGLSPDDLAGISVRNRAAAIENPHAKFRTAVTIDDVRSSRMVSDPLTLLQCSAPADGSGVVLLVSEAGAGRLGIRDALVEVIGTGHTSAGQADHTALTTFPEDAAAAAEAYAEAGISASQVGVAEVHDAFTVAQAIHLEDLGLAPRGEGWRLGVDPDVGPVINPSGGLLGRGHPLGATGMAQIDSVRRFLMDSPTAQIGLIQQAGGLQHLGQLLSTCILLRNTSPQDTTTTGRGIADVD